MQAYKARSVTPSFYSYPLVQGLLADMGADVFATRLYGFAGGNLQLDPNATCFGYVFEGHPTLRCDAGEFTLCAGMYFSVPRGGTVSGSGQGIAMARLGYHGFFHIGGPIEPTGRLKYIDGCTDSLLVPPVMLGDPCLNQLYFPPGIDQTQHTHPSMRVGMVVNGSGVCVTPREVIALTPGQVFVIPADGLHSFRTDESPMTVIAYHPDSDFGPTHENHPMINRTIVDGESAARIARIRTK